MFGTEMWERFGYYGMRALLVLYLIASVQDGGFGWTNQEALSLYGFFHHVCLFNAYDRWLVSR